MAGRPTRFSIQELSFGLLMAAASSSVNGPEGGKWLLAQEGMPVVLMQDLVFDAERSLLYAGTWGRGVYRLRLPPP